MDKRTRKVLVVENDPVYAETYEEWLLPEGYNVSFAKDADEALRKIRSTRPDLILLNLQIPPKLSVEGGLALMREAREEHPPARVVITTDDGTSATALAAMRQGATDYLVKPIDPDVLLVVIERALEKKFLVDQVRRLQQQLEKRHSFEGMIGNSAKMLEVFALVEKAAVTSANVLLRGESGTGKELVARAIHARSSRSAGPIVTLNCAALPESLLESELFGHVRGAYTDAKESRVGLIESADGGTLFLDEIGDLSPSTQVKLLRVLQEHEITRLGGNRPIRVDARIISATNKNLEKLRDEGSFREDLYYRLAAFSLYLPRLRSRGDDIQVLADYFLAQFSETDKKSILGFSPEAAEVLMAYSWPGNVRELSNEVHGAIARAEPDGLIEPKHFSANLQDLGDLMLLTTHKSGSLSEVLARVEQHIIKEKLQHHGGNRTATAKSLGVSRVTLHQKMSKYGIT